jgi:glycosyltransferase involved in cell wall biosynthesis
MEMEEKKHNSKYTYSLIVATYNRLEEMRELIASLDALRYPANDFELVVVDDGSSDGTAGFIENVEVDFDIQYHFQQNQGPGAARNRAMKEAKGAYFIFLDSDVIVPADYLELVHKSVTENQWDAFGGPDDSHPSFSPLLKAINYSMTSFIGTGGTRGSSESVTRFYPRSFNMGIHKKVFDEIGGMNDLRHGQDMDYSVRIYRAGFKVGLIKDASVYHKRRTSLRKFYKQIFNWGVARINLGRAYPEMLKLIHLLPAMLIGFILLSIGFALFNPLVWWLVLYLVFGAFGVAIYAFYDSYRKNMSIRVAYLSVLTLFIQVFAYGLGTISGLWQWLLGKGRAEGFTKNYYK